VQAARPHPGQAATARRLRELLGPDAAAPGARVQDPYGLRALPQVHGPAVDALGQVERVLRTDVNAAAENPLMDCLSGRVLHIGNFHGAYLALALDAARLAVCADAALSPARLATLNDPERTGLRPFLAGGPDGSSGIMILEYTASAALAELRMLAAPASLGTAVLSRGGEEHAAFSPQAARAAAAMVAPLRTLLACELVAAVRGLRQRDVTPSGDRLRAVYGRCLQRVPTDDEDHPLDVDVDRRAGHRGPGARAGRLTKATGSGGGSRARAHRRAAGFSSPRARARSGRTPRPPPSSGARGRLVQAAAVRAPLSATRRALRRRTPRPSQLAGRLPARCCR
jgi:histidine ammonia-lyase